MSDTLETDREERQEGSSEPTSEVSAGEAGTPTDPIDACRQQVVRQYRGEIMDYAAELCDDKERANAAVDRAFSRAFASWRECGRAGNFRHWVRGIVVDLCTDRAEA